MARLQLNQKDEQTVAEFRERIARLLGDRFVQTASFGSKAEGRDTPDSESIYNDPVWRVIPFLTRLREKAVPL